MFPHVDSLEYNLHWTVFNSKDFGVPQNRERVFLVGIRKDLPNDFRFPTGWNLDKRLKDVLETEVDEKYYLSDKMLNYLNTRKDNFNGGKINYKFDDDVASCINASSDLDISDNIILQGVLNDKGKIRETEISTCIDSNYGKGMDNHAQRTMIQEDPICVAMRGRDKSNPSDRTSGNKNLTQVLEPNSQGITNTITSVQKDNLILVGGIKKGEFREGTVNEFAQAERVNDPQGISCTIQSSGGGLGSKTGLYFVGAVQNGKLDNSKNSGEYPQGSRVYHENGLSKTITAQAAGIGGNSGAYKIQKRIRRLTPRECFRLQGFPDSFDISKVSDTQGYKQAGNTITVKVIKEICRNLESILL